jgi:hypothetical protein
VGRRIGLDDVEKRKFLTLLGLELRPPGRPARSQALYRLQVKNHITKIQNCPVLTAPNCELPSREDCIKIHALIHNQFQAPIYRNMMKYVRYAAKLINIMSGFLECKPSRIP